MSKHLVKGLSSREHKFFQSFLNKVIYVVNDKGRTEDLKIVQHLFYVLCKGGDFTRSEIEQYIKSHTFYESHEDTALEETLVAIKKYVQPLLEGKIASGDLLCQEWSRELTEKFEKRGRGKRTYGRRIPGYRFARMFWLYVDGMYPNCILDTETATELVDSVTCDSEPKDWVLAVTVHISPRGFHWCDLQTVEFSIRDRKKGDLVLSFPPIASDDTAGIKTQLECARKILFSEKLPSDHLYLWSEDVDDFVSAEGVLLDDNDRMAISVDKFGPEVARHHAVRVSIENQ